MKRPGVWHHSCQRDGSWADRRYAPCDPPCPDPWHVDLPDGETGASFATQPEAIDFARAWVTYQDEQ